MSTAGRAKMNPVYLWLLLSAASVCALTSFRRQELSGNEWWVHVRINSQDVSRANDQPSYPHGSGAAMTTRYWDCCKVSCGWRANAGAVVGGPVRSCGVWGRAGGTGENARSGCGGGDAYVCNDQVPFVRNGQAYGFAAANVNGLPMQQVCCACYKLTFTSTAVSGQTFIVQVINTGSDLNRNHFDLQLPAGGRGIFKDGCLRQWPSTPASAWGRDYGGIWSRSQCDHIPRDLQDGCRFRFDWFRNADNPHARFERVRCPSVLTDRSGCRRQDD